MMLAAGVPAGFQTAQAVAGAELGKHQRHQMVPAAERFNESVGTVTLDERLELPAIDGCQQLAENARSIASAPFLFLSLANQKIDGKAPSYGACACGISIHPTTSPDSPALMGAGITEGAVLFSAAGWAPILWGVVSASPAHLVRIMRGAALIPPPP